MQNLTRHGGRAGSQARPALGFTLVELLVVIVVIGILAAIAVPVFLSQADKASDTAVKSDVANAAKLLQVAEANGETLPSEITAGESVDLGSAGTFTPTQTLTVTGSGETLCVEGTSESGRVFSADLNEGLRDFNCAGIQTGALVTDGLVMHFDAADPKSYPGTGDPVYDLSDNGLDGRLGCKICAYSQPVYMPDHNSSNPQSFVFDGQYDLIFISGGSTVFPLVDMSWEVAFKSPGLGEGQTLGGLFSPNYGLYSHIDGEGRLYFQVADGNPAVKALRMRTPQGVSYFDDEWHVATFVLKGSSGYIYVDGVLQAQTEAEVVNRTGSTPWDGMLMRIGDNPNNVMYDFLGEMSFVRFYDRGLTEAEVVQNFEASRGRFGI